MAYDIACPLCQSTQATPFALDYYPLGHFYKCSGCLGVFKSTKLYLNEADEKSRYDTHNNSLEDDRYLNYLKKSWDRFASHLSKHPQSLLDFGCGPVKAIEHILKDQKNLNIKSWDKYYFSSPLTETFDVIFCHEVVEHFLNPDQCFKDLKAYTHSGTSICIRTEFYPESESVFRNWYYKNDPTHVFFYHPDSFDVVANKLDGKVTHIFDGNKCIIEIQ